jgi:hypothetical protein
MRMEMATAKRIQQAIDKEIVQKVNDMSKRMANILALMGVLM